MKEIRRFPKDIRNNKSGNFFCSNICCLKHQNPDHGKKYQCCQCGKEIYKPPAEVKKSKSGKLFCSHTCSATYNNPIRVIVTKPKKHCECGKRIRHKGLFCQKCYIKKTQIDNLTLEQATGHRKGPHKYISIRKAARRIYLKSDKTKICAVCGYHIHFEVCHIKQIYLFDPCSLISEINDISNLIALCPNHHWELDHELLKMGEVGFEPTTCTVMSRPL